MKVIFLILTLISLLASSNNLHSLFRDGGEVQVETTIPFEELFLRTTIETIYTPQVSEAEVNSFKMNFERYVNSVYGSMDMADDLFTNNLELFADKFSKMLNIIEHDLAKK